MSKMMREWIEEQIEMEKGRGNDPAAVRDLAALYTVHDHMCKAPPKADTGWYAQDMPEHRMHEEHKEHVEHLSKHQAEAWVDKMRTMDGRPGKRWTYDEIRQYAGNYGIMGEQNIIDFFVALNMMYSDYNQVAHKLGVDRMEFYAEMAKAFLHDPDAEPGKLARYWEYVAGDGE